MAGIVVKTHFAARLFAAETGGAFDVTGAIVLSDLWERAKRTCACGAPGSRQFSVDQIGSGSTRLGDELVRGLTFFDPVDQRCECVELISGGAAGRAVTHAGNDEESRVFIGRDGHGRLQGLVPLDCVCQREYSVARSVVSE